MKEEKKGSYIIKQGRMMYKLYKNRIHFNE